MSNETVKKIKKVGLRYKETEAKGQETPLTVSSTVGWIVLKKVLFITDTDINSD